MVKIEFKTGEQHVNGHYRQEVVEAWIEGVKFTCPVNTVREAEHVVMVLSQRLGLDKPSTVEAAPRIVERCELCQGTGEVVTRCSRYGAPSRCTQCHGRGSL